MNEDHQCECSKKTCSYCRDDLKSYEGYTRKQRTQKQIRIDIDRQGKLCNYPKCSRAEMVLPFSEFPAHGVSPDGRQSWCRDCHSKYKRTKNAFVSNANYENNNKVTRKQNNRDRMRSYKALNEALQKMKEYLTHKPMCGKTVGDEGACACGLDELMKVLKHR